MLAHRCHCLLLLTEKRRGVRLGAVSRQPLRFWWIGASALFVCIGSFGPWAKIFVITANGLDGDGWLTLVAGLAALGLIAVYVRSNRRPRPMWPLLATVVLAGIAAAIGVYDWAQIERVVDTSSEEEPFDFSISVGWGLVLMTISAFSLGISALVVLFRRAREADVAESRVPSGKPAERSEQDPDEHHGGGGSDE